MLLRWIVAAIHLLALGIGLGAIWARSRALRGLPDASSVQRALYADTLWGIAALLWISTGLARAFAGLERGSAYYLSSNLFWVKMALLGIVLLLEIWPMSPSSAGACNYPRASVSTPALAGGSPASVSCKQFSSSSWSSWRRPWLAALAPEPAGFVP